MAASVEAALRFTDRVPFDVAILDVNLRGGTVARFADKLVELGRPFIFLTGYGDLELLEEHLRDRPRLDKPVDPEVLITTMADLLAVSEPP
jgi:DNA-binding NtrC family response regulator